VNLKGIKRANEEDEKEIAKYSKIDIKRGSINSGSNEMSNQNSNETSPMKFKDLERLRMKGELLT